MTRTGTPSRNEWSHESGRHRRNGPPPEPRRTTLTHVEDMNELAQREARAQHGIIEFAEEMQAIRDGNLYPGARAVPDAWGNYCKERWGLSGSNVDRTIRALPVLRRLTVRGAHDEMPSIGAAAEVSTLPEAVQDGILGETTNRDIVKAKAKAARKVAKTIEANEGRHATDEEMITAAETVKPKPKKKAKKHSRFTRYLEAAYYEVQQAADYAQGDVLSDTENDFAWNRVGKIRYQLERIEEKLYQPETVKNIDESFAELLAEDES